MFPWIYSILYYVDLLFLNLRSLPTAGTDVVVSSYRHSLGTVPGAIYPGKVSPGDVASWNTVDQTSHM